MGCDESFITMKLMWHIYLVLSLGNIVHETSTKTGLTRHKVVSASYCVDAIWNLEYTRNASGVAAYDHVWATCIAGGAFFFRILW